MVNYQKGKIYKICSPNTDKIYIGSTVQTLKRRLNNHNQKKDCTADIIINAGNPYIVLIENYPCNSKKELLIREGYHQKLNKDIIVNICINGRTYKEYYNDIKNKKLKQVKEYRKNNRNKIKQYKSKQFECECGIIYQYCSKVRHKKTKTHIDYMNGNWVFKIDF